MRHSTTSITTTNYFFTPNYNKPFKLTPRLREPCLPMARPIPVENIAHLADEIKPKEAKSFLDFTINGLKNRSSKNLLVGTVSGWLSGVGLMRVGKIAAFGLGGGVLILHFANEGGYIHVNWERVKETLAHTQAWLDSALAFLKRNSCFSVGFIGGFFFGVACA